MNNIQKGINERLKASFPEVNCKVKLNERKIAFVYGKCAAWEEVIDVCHFVAELPGVRNVVNKLIVPGLHIPAVDYAAPASKGREIGVIRDADVVIVGGGITGCGVARELSKYDLKIILVEKSEDVSTGASKANNGNIHPGHAVKYGTLKHKLNILGNRMYDKWAEELNFEFQRNGLMYIAWEEEFLPALKTRYEKGLKNGVDGIRYITGEEAVAIEPKLGRLPSKPIAAVWLPSLAHVEPYEVVVALAENAAENGVEFMLDTRVCDIVHDNKIYQVVTSEGIINTKYLINCAGVYADDISRMAGDESFSIHPRKGTIIILDKAKPYPYKPQLGFVSANLESRMKNTKNKESKGGGCCKTPEGNYLLGPSAKEIPNKEDVSSDIDGIKYALSCQQHEGVSEKDVIRAFTGVRAADFKEDFIIEMSDVTSGLLNVAAIQSPGLTAAPAICSMAERIFLEHWKKNQGDISKKKDYKPYRKKRPVFRKLDFEEKQELIKKNPAYANIVCRCEMITEGEILEAMNSPVIPKSVDAIKRRTRAGMGRCQGGFCQISVMKLLAKHQNTTLDKINISEKGSHVLKL